MKKKIVVYSWLTKGETVGKMAENGVCSYGSSTVSGAIKDRYGVEGNDDRPLVKVTVEIIPSPKGK